MNTVQPGVIGQQAKENVEFMTPEEASGLTRLAAQTLARLRSEGGGPPFIRAGRKIVYSREDLIAWMNSRRMMNTRAAAVQAA